MSDWRAHHILRRVLTITLVPIVIAASATGIASAAPGPVADVLWKVTLVAQPTIFTVSEDRPGTANPVDQYSLELTNVGSSESSSEQVKVTYTLPAGVTVASAIEGTGWECPGVIGSASFTCVYKTRVPRLEDAPVLRIPVAVALPGPLNARVVVTGGGAPVAVAETPTSASEPGAPLPSFAFQELSNQTSGLSGASDIQAGDHPYALTTALGLTEIEQNHFAEGSIQRPKAMEFELPAGLIGNPLAAPRCTAVEVFAHRCRPATRVGTVFANLGQGLLQGESPDPIYNMVPDHGQPAEFGFFLENLQQLVLLYASVGPPPEYRVRVVVPAIPYIAATTSAIATFFGAPSTMANETTLGQEQGVVPFLTNPSDCSGASLSMRVKAVTWEEPLNDLEEAGNGISGEALSLPVAGCNQLQFKPTLSLAPEATLADEPTGYTVELKVPQAPPTGVEGLATPPLKNSTATLPLGLSLSPAAADGLAVCPAEGPEGIDLTSRERGHCPLASQVGTLEATTPVLSEPLQGQVYVAQPGCGGPGQEACTEADAQDGNLFGIYLQLEGSGVVIKLHGAATVNPASGQLTTTFHETPQQPISDLKLKLKGGPRAPLANPQACGEALGTSDLTPWSSPETPDATSIFGLNVTGCDGSPFAPTFVAGTTSTNAGAYTNFTTTFGRSDRVQDLSAIQVHTPPGLLGTLSHVTLCQEPQAALGACSSASQIGTVTAGVGPGSHPYWVSGPVYLTGPYRGAPFGLTVAIPAKAGPFNLGTVVRRATLNADPSTSALTITSDPLPQTIDGVPLRVQTVNVTVDKSQFMFNPTSCQAKQITATIASAQGASAQLSSPFAAGGCKNLPFNPGFKVSTRAPGSKKKGTSLDAKVTSASGQANIHSVSVSLPKQLPSRLTTIQQACPEATFADNPATCPVGSLVGIAKGTTPVLPVAVVGPAYLVSHGGAAFPNLELVLQGEGVRVDLTGNINIKHGITSSTFANVPDVPISSFDLRLPEGKYSALTPNGSLCAKPLEMPTTLIGQNGRKLVRTTRVAVAGCPKVKSGKVKKKVRK